MIDSTEQIKTDVRNQADAAGCLSKTFSRRPEAKLDFTLAFNHALDNGRKNISLTKQLYGEYSRTAMRYTKLYPDWRSRFANENRIDTLDRLIDGFYTDVKKRGGLTIDLLAGIYDSLNINQLLVDGNNRASILALTHILAQYGFPPPNFSRISSDRLQELEKKFPLNHRKAVVEFLRESLGAIPLR